MEYQIHSYFRSGNFGDKRELENQKIKFSLFDIDKESDKQSDLINIDTRSMFLNCFSVNLDIEDTLDVTEAY